MRKYFREDTVGRTIFICAVILVTALTLSIGSLGIVNKVATLRNDLVKLEDEFIAEQEELLRADVNSLVNRIESRQQVLLEELEADLEHRVEEARAIVANIHEEASGKLTRSEIIELIGEAIRPIRFHSTFGYCFILDIRGEVVLYPVNIRLENTNFLESDIPNAPAVVREMIELSKSEGRGFANYDWFKPGEDQAEIIPKISYISYYEPLELIIGTGEYLDDLETIAKSSIMNDLRQSWRSTTMDYYFVYELHDMAGGDDFATMLININRTDLEGLKISDDVADVSGFAYRKAFMDGIRKDGEASVVYWYRKPDGSGVGRKLSYFKFYPRWNWIVARGIYFDRLEAEITSQKAQLKTRMNRELMQLGGIFLLGVGLSLLLAYWFSRQLQTIFDEYNQSRKKNMSELKKLNQTLATQNRTDSLTGIANRLHFNERLELGVDQVSRYGGEVSLIMFDIDHFKRINDIHGHLQGDLVLQAVTRLITGNIRKVDLFARWGGEEFVILTPGIDEEKALQLANKLRIIIEHSDFPHGERLTCSFGVGRYFLGELTKDYLHRVDCALYTAKKNGRNCCVIADPPEQEGV